MPEQLIDHPPEHEPHAAERSPISDQAIEDAASTEDVGAQPDPEAPDFLRRTIPRGARRSFLFADVKWPANDLEAPDYAFLASLPETDVFDLTYESLETLIGTGRYGPYRHNNAIAFALRGAVLENGYEVEDAASVRIKPTRPDHRRFKCVIGFYFPDTKLINAYTGSTVPCRKAVAGYANGGTNCNMLPTGMHTFYVWRHRNIQPALRMGKSSQDPETGADATVLRSRNNGEMETRDIFDFSTPYDNVHCSYYLQEDADLGASFSSWGCLTVRGKRTPSEQWAKFQAILTKIGSKQRVDLLLATGKEAALASTGDYDAELIALRFGSRGEEVARLQQHLGLPQTGYLGASTLDKMTGAERAHNHDNGNGKRATGVYTPLIDRSTDWGVFT